jgi:hypothetical protein
MIEEKDEKFVSNDEKQKQHECKEVWERSWCLGARGKWVLGIG